MNEKEMERLIKKTQKKAERTHHKKDPSNYDATLRPQDILDSETKQIFKEMKNKGKHGGPSGHED